MSVVVVPSVSHTSICVTSVETSVLVRVIGSIVCWNCGNSIVTVSVSLFTGSSPLSEEHAAIMAAAAIRKTHFFIVTLFVLEFIKKGKFPTVSTIVVSLTSMVRRIVHTAGNHIPFVENSLYLRSETAAKVQHKSETNEQIPIFLTESKPKTTKCLYSV